MANIDLGIAGRSALVCGASKGLGRGCADALARAGVAVTIVARGADALHAAAREIAAAHGVAVTPVAADVTTADGRAAVLAACPSPDILVTNAGGPPPGDFRAWDEAAWHAALEANMVTPIMLIRATVDGMAQRGFGRIVNITSAAVKAPIDVLGLSNGARTGLTGFVAGLARQVARDGVTINNLLPGPFETDRLHGLMASAAAKEGVGVDVLLDRRRAGNPTRRFGQPEEFGMMCAFIASAHAGYMTGQNIVLDGGAYPGTF
jgi:3-oxoacyl-[acyl-carrier protein] reductase